MNALPALPVRMRDTNGLYSMIAIDQRDSLRAMLAGSGDVPVTDDRMREGPIRDRAKAERQVVHEWFDASWLRT